jgi:hypothetical protein
MPVHNKYALEIMHRKLSHNNFSVGGQQNIPMYLPIPNIRIDTLDHKIAHLQLYSSGTCFIDTWEFNIKLDPYSGIISDFNIAFGKTCCVSTTKPASAVMSF